MMPSTWDLIATVRSDWTLPIDSITRGTSWRCATATCTGTAAAALTAVAGSRLQLANSAQASSPDKIRGRVTGEVMLSARRLGAGPHTKHDRF